MKTILLGIAAALATASVAQTGMIKESKAQRDARMGWWREARLGMFIHWGLYAIPAGEWKGAKGHGEWIRETAQIPLEEYLPFKDQFNPVKFDANAWVKTAKDAGMKYIVITTKHHDGFALFDSKVSEWDVMSTPFQRDIMRELAEACRKEGIRLGWYHSIMDWHHPDYLPRRGWEEKVRPATGAKFTRFVEHLRSQVTELLTNYGPVDVMWFDGEWESTWNDAWGKPLYELCRTLQPKTIVNNRVSNSRAGSMEAAGMDEGAVGDFSTPEQHIPATGLPGVDWETCMTMNDHWGWNKNDKNWKSAEQLIRNIVDIASKGGNYLLNIGPTAEGEFPPESVERLAAIGRWMKANGESIYETSASVFEDLPWGRSTTRGDTLYLHPFIWPTDGKLIVPGLGSEAKSARVLSSGEKLNVRRSGANLVVEVPRTSPDPICPTIELVLEGQPVVYRTPKIVAPTDIVVKPMLVSIDAGSKDLDVHYTLDGKSPTVKSLKYVRPFPVHRKTHIVAASFHNGKKVSADEALVIRQVRPWPALQLFRAPDPGIRMDTYKGDWDKIPNFPDLYARDTAVVATIGLDLEASPEEHVGRRYTGHIDVPENAVYKFALTSDDGAQLWIDGKLVVDLDGLHSAETKVGHAPLAKGYHAIEVRWFNKTGAATLDLKWAQAGSKLVPVQGGVLTH